MNSAPYLRDSDDLSCLSRTKFTPEKIKAFEDNGRYTLIEEKEIKDSNETLYDYHFIRNTVDTPLTIKIDPILHKKLQNKADYLQLPIETVINNVLRDWTNK